MQLIKTLLCTAGLLTFSATAQAPNDVRIALIIGNSAYPGNMALANPSNDAKDMAATLRNMGFGVIEVRDASHEQMTAAIERTNKELNGKQGVGMLFYAGHGLQLDWRNYMVPVDAKLNSATDVPKQAVDIEVVMKAFQSAGNRMNIVVLDACRDNPFADGKTSTGKGLAPLDAPTGTFLAYATAPGNVAADGEAGSKNGLYTGYLLQELQKPTARIEDVFKRVRFSVRKASDGAQIPWETTSLEDDFVFNSGIKKVVKLTDDEKEKRFDIEKVDWERIASSTKADDFYAFLQKYPTGLFAQGAMGIVDRLSKTKTTAYVDKNGIKHDANKAMFHVGDSIELVRKDGYSGQEMRTRSPLISSIKDGIVSLSGDGIFTTRGEVIYSPGVGNTFDPPRPYVPADGIAIGKKWTSRSTVSSDDPDANNGRNRRRQGSRGSSVNWVEDEGRVVAVETITVPAGTFKTFKIERNSVNRGGARTKNVYWMLPDFGFILKQTMEVRRRNGSTDLWSEEAVSITRGAS
jgi:Caspase domain